MATRTQEAPQQRIPELHFKPEGYVSTGDEEYLDELLAKLKASGYEPDDLVFSGFDGSALAGGQESERHPYIFVMNEAGWREAIKRQEENPAGYAVGWETPCIGLYERQQLVYVYASGIEGGVDDRVELSDIVRGEALADLPAATPVQEAVVHSDYPEASPTDALVGLVYLDQE